MERCVRPELLDALPPADATARHSRRDLGVLNAWMGNAKIMAHQLRQLRGTEAPALVAELGGGDGTELLRMARHLGWRGVTAVLVDRHVLVSDKTIRAFQERWWTLRPRQADVFDWLKAPECSGDVVMLANLFLHHFTQAQLVDLLLLVARRGVAFVAVEPRRNRAALAASRLVRLLGCNAVTRHDAPLSVRAGFTGADLSTLWPRDPDWTLQEGRAGLFSHVFSAVRLRYQLQRAA